MDKQVDNEVDKVMAQSEKRTDTADKSVLFFSFCSANFWSLDVVFVKTVQNASERGHSG